MLLKSYCLNNIVDARPTLPHIDDLSVFFVFYWDISFQRVSWQYHSLQCSWHLSFQSDSLQNFSYWHIGIMCKFPNMQSPRLPLHSERAKVSIWKRAWKEGNIDLYNVIKQIHSSITLEINGK